MITQTHDKTYLEFFAGIGLVGKGLEGSGWRCLYAGDIDRQKREMFESHFGCRDYYHIDDVWNTSTVVSRITEKPFLATASFPCIDLSQAGHRQGITGKHSGTFFGFVQVVEALGDKRPDVVMLENVEGFVKARGGADFKAAVTRLADLGYVVDAFLLDAKEFVPQSRPRVFVLGFNENVDWPLLARQGNGCWCDTMDQHPSLRTPKMRDIMSHLPLRHGWAATPIKPPHQHNLKLAEMIDTDSGQAWWEREKVVKEYRSLSDKHRTTIDGMLQGGGLHVGCGYRRKRDISRLEVRFDMAGCLRTPGGGSSIQIVVVVDAGDLRMREMSPAEYARLQGAGDFRLVKNKRRNLYGFGDAVCVPVIEWIDQCVLTPAFDAAQSC